MLSPGPSTAAAGISNSSSSTPLAGDLTQSPHLPPPNMASTLAFPLVDISENMPDSTEVPLSSSPPKSFVKSPSASLSFSSPPLSKSTSPQISKPPLPAQQPSALPKSTSSPLPRPPPPPAVRALSPPQSRPPPPVIAKPPVSGTNKPAHPNISIMEKLIKTCPVWLQLGMRKDKAMDLLSKEPPGIFIIRKDCSEKQMILSVRLPDQQGEPNVNELPVKEEKSFLYLEGSVLVFENIFKLVAFYCVSRDILPFPLRLPQVILQVIKYEDMEVISSLGSEFWSSALNIHDNVENDHQGQSSCEIQLSTSSGRLWNVNPVFIEECSNSSPPTSSTQVLRTQSLNSPIQSPPKYKRPPPLRPRPPSAPECLHPASAKTQKGEFKTDLSSPPSTIQKEEGSDSVFAVSDQEKQGTLAQGIENDKPAISQLLCTEGKKLKYPAPESRVPPVPVRRKLSDKQHSEDATPQEVTTIEAEDCVSQVPFASLVCLDDSMEEQEKPLESQTLRLQNVPEESSAVPNGSPLRSQTIEAQTKKHSAPVVPPRRKRQSQNLNGKPIQSFRNLLTSTNESTSASSLNPSSPRAIRHPVFPNVGHPKALDISLYSPEGGAPQPEHDSYSTSSTEEEADLATGGGMKRTSIIMLDRAKQRLSMVSMANFSNVITGFMSTERKLQKRIVELARDGNTYFGNLVKDYRTFTLETMRKHISSTEMLQEIRQMMTQLKSYLIQSAELENLQEAATHSEEKLEVIVEAAICKSVLKPLREHVYSGLRDIHSRLGNIKKLKENQQVVLNSTTTDLGVITSVPETAVMEKIQAKLSILHQEYSPQKKIDLLLKTCKTIYDSMSVGSPGKAFGADDFLPVLMYVLARSNITALLLDVEYMMELMDPALQLGEGSYYLTTTYGALEHIKNFDKQPVTKQLSLEIQDSIHRWERRRTLNKARASRSSLQDFINVSFLEAGSNTKTLGVRPGTTAQNLSRECAEKFEVLDPDSYCLSLLVEGNYKPLGPEEFPLIVKTELHHSNPRKDYYFVYRHGRWPDLHDKTLSPSVAEESLI